MLLAIIMWPYKKWRGGLCLRFSFFFIILKSCGSEGRGVGRISWNQKFFWGGGGGGRNKMTEKKKKKKNDNHTKTPNTKNQKYGEKSFIQRTCKYWSYPGPGLYCYCYSHTHRHTHTHLHTYTHIKSQSIPPSTHPVCVSIMCLL